MAGRVVQGGQAASGPPARQPGATSVPVAVGARPARRWPRRMLVTINLLVVVLLVAAGSAYGYVRWQLSKTHHIAVKGLVLPPSDRSPMTILAVGSDTRDLGTGANAAFGSGQSVSGQRSDTIMLLRVVPQTASIAILSIPRDLLVNVPGLGYTRINSAFNTGPSLLVATIEQDLGIKINHFMVLNFYTFTQVADSLGGVYQYFPAPARDLFSGLTVTHAGCVLLKGANALGFVRSREYQYYLDGQWQYQLYPESDLARIQRQQDFIKLAIKKAEHVNPANITGLNSVLSGITSSLTVDSTFSTSLMLELADTFRHTNVAAIANWTYPTLNSTEVAGALQTDPAADQAMVARFLSYGLPAAATSAGSSPTSTGPSSLPAQPTGGPSSSAAHLAVDVVGASSAGAATAAAAQVNPDASSYYDGRYVPPGLQPGEVPASCPA